MEPTGSAVHQRVVGHGDGIASACGDDVGVPLLK
jgi:hypothetical protein